MAFIIVILFVIVAVIVLGKTPVTIKNNWQTFVDGFSVSASEFYDVVKAGLQERQITHVDVAQESFLEKHIFSAQRMYLRVIQDEYVFYICCAPYGTGTFFSSWLCIKDEKFINKIPLLSKLMGKDRNNKTFYQMDTEGMFRSSVHTTVIEAVNSLTEAKGKRGLTELEKQFKDFK